MHGPVVIRQCKPTRAGGVPARVSVKIPRISFTGPGGSATLPVGPCQHIYRFKFEKVRAPGGKAPRRFVT